MAWEDGLEAYFVGNSLAEQTGNYGWEIGNSPSITNVDGYSVIEFVADPSGSNHSYLRSADLGAAIRSLNNSTITILYRARISTYVSAYFVETGEQAGRCVGVRMVPTYVSTLTNTLTDGVDYQNPRFFYDTTTIWGNIGIEIGDQYNVKRIYSNGVLQEELATSFVFTSLTSTNGSNRLYIGRQAKDNILYGRGWSGYVERIGFWFRRVTQEEQQAFFGISGSVAQTRRRRSGRGFTL